MPPRASATAGRRTRCPGCEPSRGQEVVRSRHVRHERRRQREEWRRCEALRGAASGGVEHDVEGQPAVALVERAPPVDAARHGRAADVAAVGHRLVAFARGGPRGRCRSRRARRRRGHRAARRDGGRARTGRHPSRTCAGWSRPGRRWRRWPRRPLIRRRAASRRPRRTRRGRPSTPCRRRRSGWGSVAARACPEPSQGPSPPQGRGEPGRVGGCRHAGARWSGGVVRCCTARVDQRTTLGRGTIALQRGVHRCTAEVAERTTLDSLGPGHGRP